MAEFDDFAEELTRQAENRRKLSEDAAPEWAVLLGFVASLAADGKGINERKFEWAPDTYEPRLVLDCVAATFISKQRSGVQTFRVHFGRRPAGVNQVWALDRSPLNQFIWSFKPVVENDAIMWSIVEGFEDGKALSSFEMSQKIGIELAKYHLAYLARVENLSFEEMEELSDWKSVRDLP